MPSLCSIEAQRTSLRAPSEPSSLTQELRHEEQRDAARARRRVGQPRQHEMDDVVGEVVLAVGDEDLLAGDAVAAVAGALGLRAQRADVGAGLRLGEVHRARPFAGDELRRDRCACSVVGAVRGERLDRAHGQHRADAERHRGRVPHLDAGGVERVRQPLAAPFVGRRKRRSSRPPTQAAIGLLPAGRRGDGAVLERRAELVADRVERRDHRRWRTCRPPPARRRRRPRRDRRRAPRPARAPSPRRA